MRNKFFLPAAAAIAALAANPAVAGNPEGRFQVKVMMSGVVADGKIDKVQVNHIPLPNGSHTKANDNAVPTIALEYFATPNFSIETICCVTKHKVHGRGAVDGAELARNVHIVPATLTLKYHVDTGTGLKPYVGVGPSFYLFAGEKPGADTQALGGTDVKFNNRFGAALQAGFDVAVNDSGFGISVDAKRYFLRTNFHVYDAAGTEVLRSKHKLDPWVFSGGVYYRF